MALGSRTLYKVEELIQVLQDRKSQTWTRIEQATFCLSLRGSVAEISWRSSRKTDYVIVHPVLHSYVANVHRSDRRGSFIDYTQSIRYFSEMVIYQTRLTVTQFEFGRRIYGRSIVEYPPRSLFMRLTY